MMTMTQTRRMVLEMVREAGGTEYTETLYEAVSASRPGPGSDPHRHARRVVGDLERAGMLSWDEQTSAAMGRSVLTDEGRAALGG